MAVRRAGLAMLPSPGPRVVAEAILKATILGPPAVALLLARGQPTLAAEGVTDLSRGAAYALTLIDTGAPLGRAEVLIAVLSRDTVIASWTVLCPLARARAEAFPAALIGQAGGGAL